MAKIRKGAGHAGIRRPTLPKRSSKLGVGKEIGGAVYVHRRYEAVLDPGLSEAQKRLPADFNYTVVKFSYATGVFSFIRSPDFDIAAEPVVAEVVTVGIDGSVRLRKPPSDPYIYHHKWLFVKDEYPGFDVEKSKSRSAGWMALEGIDFRRIGRKSYWETKVVPRIPST